MIQEKNFTKTCPNFDKVNEWVWMNFVKQTCPNLSKLVQTCPNLSKLVQTCPNLSKLVQTCPNLTKPVQTCPNCYIDACLNQNWKHICLHYEPILLSATFVQSLLDCFVIDLSFFHGDRSNQDFTNIIYDLPFISTSTEYPPIRSSVHYSLSGITNEWVIWLLLVSSQP